jgi:aspartyl-tRNA(Asn)/glutamyl-tRNA(Gln) amidotransferase subunit B
VSREWIAEVRATLRETPREKRRRFMTVYALSAADADLLSSARPLAEYFETVAAIVAPRLAASWVTGEVLRWMKEQKLSPEEAGEFSVSPAQLGDLIGFVGSGAISNSAAKTVFEEMVRSGRPALEIIREKNLERLSDESSLAGAIEGVLRDNPGPVAQYRSGKAATFGFLVGCAMKATGGRADPETVRRLLRSKLEA